MAMSVSTGIALIIGDILVICFLYFYLSVHANKYGNQILTGVVEGIPVSTDYRWIILYWHWFGFAFGAVSCAFLGVIVNLTIARHAPHQDVETVAYAVAFLSGMACIGWLSSIFVEFVHYRSVIKQGEAD
jgi:hypothetical protein